MTVWQFILHALGWLPWIVGGVAVGYFILACAAVCRASNAYVREAEVRWRDLRWRK